MREREGERERVREREREQTKNRKIKRISNSYFVNGKEIKRKRLKRGRRSKRSLTEH